MRSAPRIDTVCTLIATDARAMGDPPPLYVSIIGESCLGIYTLELVVGCWVDGLQHFKKPEILFDVFTVLGLHQQKFCVSFPRFILNNFFPNRRRGPIAYRYLCCCLDVAPHICHGIARARVMQGAFFSKILSEGSNFQFRIHDN